METPVRSLTVTSTRDLGPQFAGNTVRMVGQDGAYSIPLDNCSLWFFGDTLIGARAPDQSLWYLDGKPVGHVDLTGRGRFEKMWNNCGLLLFNGTGKNGLDRYRYVTDHSGKIRPLIPLHAGEDSNRTRIWCLHGCYFNSRVYLYFIEVAMLESGPFPVNFEIVGSGLAEGSREELTFRRVVHKGDHLLWHWPLPAFASAVLSDEQNNVLYLFGVRKNGNGTQECCLARVRPDRITEPSQYEYLVSASLEWGKDPAQCVSLFTGVPNELSVSYNQYLGCYLSVHSLDLTGSIVGRTSPAPWGPWSEPMELWKVRSSKPHTQPYPQLIYAGKEHPELCEADGATIYLTYVEFEEYYPHLIEVTLG